MENSFEINGIRLEIDMADVDFIERYEAAFEKMQEEEEKLPQNAKNSNIAAAYVKMFYNLFDNIFGDGTGNKVFDGKRNLNLCLEAYDRFFEICTKQVEENNKTMSKIFSKYTPQKRG